MDFNELLISINTNDTQKKCHIRARDNKYHEAGKKKIHSHEHISATVANMGISFGRLKIEDLARFQS